MSQVTNAYNGALLLVVAIATKNNSTPDRTNSYNIMSLLIINTNICLKTIWPVFKYIMVQMSRFFLILYVLIAYMSVVIDSANIMLKS